MALNVYYQNVRGLRTKLNEFLLNSMGNYHDLLFISESWLNDNINDSELVDINHYSVFRRDRCASDCAKKDGGGVFVAVRNNLNPVRLLNFQSGAEDV